MHFRTWERIQFAIIKQANFWMAIVVLLCVLLVVLVIMDENWQNIFWGLCAVGNTVMLCVVILLLGYGLAEYPISLWQDARLTPTLRRLRSEAWEQHVKFDRVSKVLATKLALVYELRQRASSSLRHLGQHILQMTEECPVDVSRVLLMHPVRGPSIPVTAEEKEKALYAALQQIERERTHGSDMTEVDAWLEVLESEKVLRAGVDVCSLQDALYDAKLKTMGDLDFLDPINADPNTTHAQRLENIVKGIYALMPPEVQHSSAGEDATLLQLGEAIIRRNNASLRIHRGILGEDFMSQGFIREAARMEELLWTELKLVRLRTELTHLTRQYRIAKRRFDIAVAKHILLQDTQAAFWSLQPPRTMYVTLYRAWTAPAGGGGGDEEAAGGRRAERLWRGVESPVRVPFGGKYGLRLEVLWFVWECMAARVLKVVGAGLCAAMSATFLWSEMSVAPWVRVHFNGPQQGSLLLHQVCWCSTLPPVCQFALADPSFAAKFSAAAAAAANAITTKGGDSSAAAAAASAAAAAATAPQMGVVTAVAGAAVFGPSGPVDQVEYEVSATVQLIIMCQLIYFMQICHFSLQRLRLWRLYEVVPGETDAKSLLVNAFLVCRIVPSITQNYLNMIREAHEERDDATEVTVFENTFSIMGKIPFVGSSFNEVLPPLLMAFFALNVSFILARLCFSTPTGRRFELFAFLEALTEETFTAQEEEEVSVMIAQERKRYVRLRNMDKLGRRGRTLPVRGSLHENLAAVREHLASARGHWDATKAQMHSAIVQSARKLKRSRSESSLSTRVQHNGSASAASTSTGDCDGILSDGADSADGSDQPRVTELSPLPPKSNLMNQSHQFQQSQPSSGIRSATVIWPQSRASPSWRASSSGASVPPLLPQWSQRSPLLVPERYILYCVCVHTHIALGVLVGQERGSGARRPLNCDLWNWF
jgi:hypothetical protein